METNLIDIQTFRKTLKLGRDYTYKAAREGRLKAWKPNGEWRVPISELHDFPAREIAAREIAAQS